MLPACVYFCLIALLFALSGISVGISFGNVLTSRPIELELRLCLVVKLFVLGGKAVLPVDCTAVRSFRCSVCCVVGVGGVALLMSLSSLRLIWRPCCWCCW